MPPGYGAAPPMHAEIFHNSFMHWKKIYTGDIGTTPNPDLRPITPQIGQISSGPFDYIIVRYLSGRIRGTLLPLTLVNEIFEFQNYFTIMVKVSHSNRGNCNVYVVFSSLLHFAFVNFCSRPLDLYPTMETFLLSLEFSGQYFATHPLVDS